jgi:hypothetical protein
LVSNIFVFKVARRDWSRSNKAGVESFEEAAFTGRRSSCSCLYCSFQAHYFSGLLSSSFFFLLISYLLFTANHAFFWGVIFFLGFMIVLFFHETNNDDDEIAVN